MDKLFDRYSLQARLLPALIVLLPIGAAVLALVPKADDLTKPLLGLVAGAGALVLVAHIARGAGKSVERKLIERWGGWPSTLLLRLTDQTIDPRTKSRIHARLQQIVPGIAMPGREEEAADQAGANETYTACASFLISQTRDTKQFGLLFIENINYGFRRNLLGLKWPGLLACAASAAILARPVAVAMQQRHEPSFVQVSALFLCLVLLAIWFFVIRPGWVYAAAVDYARRLIECVDRLPVRALGGQDQ